MLQGGAPVDLGGARPQTLLALLALRAGSPVSLDFLTEGLWAGEPPDGSPTTLRSYVSRLRTALGPAAPIERRASGYVLDVPGDWVDVVRFETTVRAGRELLERGRLRRAGAALREALELWRGAPFTGVPVDGTLRAESTRLEELWLHAVESRIEADLATGRAEQLIDELEGLLATHPFRERLWHHLMLALYRAGRQADALAAYHRARAALDVQLGIEPSEELRELEAAILRQEVPTPRTAPQAAAGLPVPLTTFVGREREIDEVLALLRRSRLVTLVGVGGVGKTRLAIEAAGRGVAELADAVTFVDLASLQDPGLVPAHVASALGMAEESGGNLATAIDEQLGGAELVIVLDNCEHVRAAVATLAESLLTTSPALRILATSRELLDVPGEAAYPVPPLGVPEGPDDRDGATPSEAARLLVERAALARRDLPVDAATWHTAERIARDLEGLPLALELAAARALTFSLDEIAERIQDRFRFLVSWRRLTAARHRTLAEAMDWSYGLLAPDEQRLLARLSVFPGGATLESIAAVCLDGDVGEGERLIERLVEASLVAAIHPGGQTRYRLLETVRQHAAGHLQAEEAEALQRRHAERASEIARASNLGLEGGSHASRFDLARDELPSLRQAIAWATEHDPALGVEIASALERLWALTRPREGMAIFDALLAQNDLPDGPRAAALRARGGSRYVAGEFEAGTADYEAALAIHRRLGQPAHAAHLLMRLAVEAERTGDLAGAHRLLREAETTGGAGRFAPDRYVTVRLEATLAFAEGHADAGFELLERSVREAAAAGDTMWEVDGLVALTERALQHERRDAAAAAGRAGLRQAHAIEDRQAVIYLLAMLALHAAESGDVPRAARLWTGLEGEVERGGRVGQWEAEAADYRARIVAIAAETFETELARQERPSLDEVVSEALRPG